MKLRQSFFKGNKLWWLLYLIFMTVDSGINLLLSYILQQLTDAAVEQDMQQLIRICVVCVVSVVAILLLSSGQYYTEAKFLKRAMQQYKNAVFSGLLKKSRRSFTTENTSTYISALTNDAASIEANYLQGTVKLISYGVAFVATLAVMVAYSPMLTLAAVGLTLFPIALSMLSGNRLADKEKEVSVRNADFVSAIKDMLAGFPVIKSFRAEREMEGIYQKENAGLEQIKFQRNIVKGKIGLLSITGVLISQLGVFIVGAFLAIAGKGVTAGVLIAFVNMMGGLMNPISVIPQLYAGRKAALGLMEKMEQAVNENAVEESGETLTEFHEGIAVEDVSFGYTGECDTLKDISLKLHAGKSYAIVGGSGSGKSTLLDMMMGNFDTYRGEVKYDGKELRTIRMDSLYDLISVVQQNVFIFDSTIRENITMFKEFPEEQVKRAIGLSGLDKLIAEKGEDYLCGENGCNLSGGERQRISIARCLLRKTPILVADEATAALDAKTAYDVTDAILEMKDLTRIVVTHQLEAALLKRYDEIIVMKNGRIAETGSFDELIEKKEYFYSLYNVAA
ncbi:MAG: ABC transporter ATP-binding protein [Lachnospiraceae bacterium]